MTPFWACSQAASDLLCGRHSPLCFVCVCSNALCNQRSSKSRSTMDQISTEKCMSGDGENVGIDAKVRTVATVGDCSKSTKKIVVGRYRPILVAGADSN